MIRCGKGLQFFDGLPCFKEGVPVLGLGDPVMESPLDLANFFAILGR